MSDSVRKSSRATKGQHTKNFEPADTPTSKPRGKGKGSKGAKQASAEATPPEDDDVDAIIRCICGYVVEDEDDDRKMIICDSCDAWQHNECMEMSLDDNELPEQYFCEQCRPDLHQDLLAKVERGERPWEELARRRQQEEEEKQARRRKGGKKGKKGGRPSGVKPDLKPEPTTTNGAPSTPSTAITPAVAAEPEARAEPVQKRKLPDETPEEAKTPSQQEPQSKVRKVSSPTDSKPPVPAPRRRSSAIATPTPTPGRAAPTKRDSKPVILQMELVEDISELHNDARKKVAGALVKLFVEQTKQAQKDGAFSLPPNQSVEAFGNQLGLAAEYAIFLNFWGPSAEPSSHYPEKFRTINYNVKQNSALRNRLLTGDLSPNDFSKMSSHDMASKELQEKTAEMKRASDQQAILVEQQGPRIRRTHKGEEFVEGLESQGPMAPDSVLSAPVRRPRPDLESEKPRQASPEAATPRSPQAIEPSDDIGDAVVSPKATQPLSVDTKVPARPGVVANERKSSSNFNIQDVWSSVTGPDTDTPKPRPNFQQAEPEDALPQQQAPGGSGDADIDRLLKDEDQEEEEPYSPTEYPADPDAPVWRGKLTMQGVAEFNGIAKHVAGANLSALIPWAQLMPEIMSIEGRIDIDRASEYLCGLRWSQTTDVSVVAVRPSEEEGSKAAFDKLFQYFVDRKRYGVVGKNAVKEVKDTYLVPLEAGATKNADFVELLERCTIQAPVPERMLLITFVIRAHNSPAGQENTPRQLGTAAIASPVNAATSYQAPTPFPPPTSVGMQPGYHGSPTSAAQYHGSPPQSQGGFQGTPSQPQHPYGMPPQQQQPYLAPYAGPVGMEAAKQALGDMVHVPTVGALLNEAPRAGVVEFQIVRELFEQVPATKNDFEMLRGMLAMKLEQGPPRHG
ncbi:MAG: hypothetical protein Q9170_004498 [Blastenia crenularia]